MTRRMVTALANPHLDILGHCTGRGCVHRRARAPGGGRAESSSTRTRCSRAAVEHDKAIEINSRPERLDPPKRLLRRALEAGCRFTIDTDAHAPGQLDWLSNGCGRAVACGVPRTGSSTPLPAADLLAWTKTHK